MNAKLNSTILCFFPILCLYSIINFKKTFIFSYVVLYPPISSLASPPIVSSPLISSQVISSFSRLLSSISCFPVPMSSIFFLHVSSPLVSKSYHPLSTVLKTNALWYPPLLVLCTLSIHSLVSRPPKVLSISLFHL